jgi:hypothetical protein
MLQDRQKSNQEQQQRLVATHFGCQQANMQVHLLLLKVAALA